MQDELEIAHGMIDFITDQLEYSVKGGTEFFDRMDAVLSSDYFYQVQLDRFLEQHPDKYIVVSGKWGYGFTNWMMKYHVRSFWHMLSSTPFPGGLRHNDLPPLNMDLRTGEYVFLDNSCYRGRTRDKIASRIQECGGELIDSLILYDGSIEPLAGVKGLYRYHEMP